MVSQQRSEQTYTRLLQVAADCFAQQGFDATGVAEICSRAGVSKGAFYYHFPSKQALFVALLQHWMDGLDVQMATLREQGATVAEGLSHMAEGFEEVMCLADGRLPIFLEFILKAQRDPVVWAATVQPYRRYRELFAQLIEMGIAEGSLRPVDPQIAAQSLVSLAVGLLVQSVFDPQGENWRQAARDTIQLALGGLVAPQA